MFFFFWFHSSPCVEFPVYLQGSFVTAMSTGVVGQHRQTWLSSRAHDASRCLFSWSHSPAELLSHCTKRVVFICSWYRQTAGMCSTRGIHPHFAIRWRNKPNYAFPSFAAADYALMCRSAGHSWPFYVQYLMLDCGVWHALSPNVGHISRWQHRETLKPEPNTNDVFWFNWSGPAGLMRPW